MTKAIRLGLLAILCALVPLGSAAPQSGMLSLRQPSVTGSYMAGLAALDNMQPERAAQYFMQAAQSDWDNPVYIGRAFLAYLMAGRIADAASLAQHLIRLDPQDEVARITLASVALRQRRYASAERMLDPVRPASMIGITANLMRGWTQLGGGDVDAAFATLDEIGREGFGEFLVFHRAIMADLGGAREEALALSRRAYELDSFSPSIAEAHIRILGNAGHFAEAQAVLDAFAAEGISHPLIDALRAPIAEGRRPGLFVANVQAATAEMFHVFALALWQDGSTELAVLFLRLALYLDPDAAIASMSLGDILSAAGRFEAARAVYETIPRTSPLSTRALVRMAENLVSDDRREEAVSRLRNIVAAHAADIGARATLGDILREDERWEQAAEVYSDLLDALDQDRPRYWRYYYLRGITYERSGMWTLAEADFRRALELNPDHPHVLNYLGYSWVDQGINLEEALGMLERAAAILPQDGYIIDSLGWAYYRLGRIDEAIAKLEEALQYEPDLAEINDHLGDAYWMAGRQREARFQWRIAIHVDERGDIAEAARLKLESGLPTSP